MQRLLEDGVQVDALVCDPPAGIDFMGRKWDGDKGGRDQWIDWLRTKMEIAYQLMKPGAHGLVWALPRTSHWTGMAVELAGFEVRDRVSHLFGTGYPKNLDVSKAIDSGLGATREVVCVRESAGYEDGGTAVYANRQKSNESQVNTEGAPLITAPATEEAVQWDGFGTALKPACEDWWLIRKPLDGTVADNVLEHGTGAINVEGCRVRTSDALGGGGYTPRAQGNAWQETGGMNSSGAHAEGFEQPAGRWPPHLLLTHSARCDERRCVRGCPAGELDHQSGDAGSNGRSAASYSSPGLVYNNPVLGSGPVSASSGGASRFFPRFRYLPKPTRAEREAGCGHLPTRKGHETVDREEDSAGLANPRAGAGRTAGDVHNHHPTLKGFELMRWLCRLITPPGGTVLDPFMGSGSTGMAAVAEGFRFVGIEQDPEYVEIARARIEYVASDTFDVENGGPRPERRGQQDLWSG